MRVQVIQLRRRGLKLTPEEIRASTPLVGFLIVDRGWASLYRSPKGSPPMEVCQGLFMPKVAKIKDDSILILGSEWRSAYETSDPYRQAWWCRICRESGMSSMGAEDQHV